MGRRTKEQILEDEEMTCSKRGCNKVHEEMHMFTSYCKEAVMEDVHDLPFCKKHFQEIESKIEQLKNNKK